MESRPERLFVAIFGLALVIGAAVATARLSAQPDYGLPLRARRRSSAALTA